MPKKKKNQLLYSESEKSHYEVINKRIKLKQTLLDEMLTDHRYDDFFNQYRADTVKPFKEEFCRIKADFILDGDWYFKHKQELELFFHNEAEQFLWHIQQKKLFDLQCLWRAQKITIAEVEISEDFETWSADIKRCPFIPAITEDEIQLLQQYVLSHNYDEPLFFPHQWQDYEQFKKEHTGDEQSLSMPEWYHYYNMHRGTESLMLLPDVRGEMEAIYIKEGMDDYRKLDPSGKLAFRKILSKKTPRKKTKKQENDPDDPEPYEAPPLTAPNDRRPWIFDMQKMISEFINRFEGTELKKVHEIRQRLNEYNLRGFDSLEFQNALDLLRKAGSNYPMAPYFKWREGVIRQAQKFKQEKIAAALPVVYEQYVVRVESGIAPFLTKQELKRIQDRSDGAKEVKRWILHGRKVFGEPQDFNF